MIGTPERMEDGGTAEKEVTPSSKQVKKKSASDAKGSTPSITSFFKPPPKSSPPPTDKPSDLRNYFQVKKPIENDIGSNDQKSNVANNHDIDQKMTEQKKGCASEANESIEPEKKEGKKGKKEKGSKKEESVKNTKKRKKKTLDIEENSEEDFESPPPSRRKRKARLDSESINDAGEIEIPLQERDGHDEPAVDRDQQSVTEGEAKVQEDSRLCNEKEDGGSGMNTSTVVSYQDFLTSSMMEDDGGNEGKHEEEEESIDNSKGPVAPSEPLDPVMLTPPDSRCSQEVIDVDHTLNGEAKNEKDEEGEIKDEPPPRKVITVKAQVHSPFDGENQKRSVQDSQSSPIASPALGKDSRKEGKYCPRRLMSNVSVLDSSLELTQISVENNGEVKKSGPVYSIFQKKSASAKKEVAKEEKSETPKDLLKDEPDAKDVEKNENVEKSFEKEDIAAKETKGKDENKKVVKESLKKSTSSKDTQKETKDVKKDTKVVKESKKSKLEEKDDASSDTPESGESSPRPTKRVLRTRAGKQADTSMSLDSSMSDFDDAKPPKPKPKKDSKEQGKSAKAATTKRGRGRPKKETPPNPKAEPKRFKSSLLTGGKMGGPIKLKLTAIKASPKKNNKAAKAHQLLQKAKKGQQVTMATKKPVAPLKLSGKKLGQTTLGQTKLGQKGSTLSVSKKENVAPTKGKGKSLSKAGGTDAKKGQATKGEVKKVGSGIKTDRPDNRRRSSSRLKPKTPPKPAAKLAPIFTKQGQLAAAKKFKLDSLQAAMDESSQGSFTDGKDSQCVGELVVEQMPTLGFNMLEQLKAGGGGGGGGDASDDVAFMPFPVVGHVLQKDEENSKWRLPTPVFDKWTLSPASVSTPAPAKCDTKLGSLTFSQAPWAKEFNFKEFSGHQPLTESAQTAFLEEIIQANPRFPAKKVFKMYRAKKSGEPQKKDDAKSEKGIEGTDSASSQQTAALQRGKRKAEEVVDGEEAGSRRKMPRREGRGSARRSLEMGEGSTASEPGDGEEKTVRRSSRRSSRRLSTKEDAKTDENKEEEKEGTKKDGEKEEKQEEKDLNTAESQAERKRAGMSWTEKYQPASASELIGNAGVCKKFHSWLSEWKRKAQRMKEKTARGQKKEAKRAKGSKFDSDDDDYSDDDFRYSDSEDSDDEDGLCNTVLLVGPHGIGKTALVYACAQELGFEVFEVNPSSRRSGKQIQSELGEVTQSHQVARQPGMSSASLFHLSRTEALASKNKVASPKKKAAIPKAFAAFFKSGNSGKGSQIPTRSPVKKPSVKNTPKKQPKKSPVKKLTSANTQSTAQTKNTTTSLILFDEVDVVFDEDKGFLSAISSFMDTTKRPIILTASDPRFSYALPGRFDEHLFKRPPLNSVVNHLRLLCLAENVPTDPQDIKTVVDFFDRDIRRCMQSLQFWVSSGAMHRDDTKSSIQDHLQSSNSDSNTKESSAITLDVQKRKQNCLINGSAIPETTVGANVNGTSKNGVCAATGNGLSSELHDRKPCEPSETSADLMELGSVGAKTTSCPGSASDVVQSANKELMSCAGMRHHGFFASLVGLGNVAGPVTDILRLLKEFGTQRLHPTLQASILEVFHNLQVDLSHHNLSQLLPQIGNNSKVAPSNQKSESSLPNKQGASDAQKTARSKLGGDLVRIMSDHAENMSSIDIMLPHGHKQDASMGRYGNQDWWQPLSLPGLDDSEDGVDFETVDVRPYDARTELIVGELNRWVESGSLTNCVRKCRETVDAARSGISEMEFSETMQPVLSHCGDGLLRLQHAATGSSLRETHGAVVNKLPEYQYTNHPALALDYLPTLRGICRSEELRKEANLKRRFFHYLDSTSFLLKPATYLTMASILNPDKGPF